MPHIYTSTHSHTKYILYTHIYLGHIRSHKADNIKQALSSFGHVCLLEMNDELSDYVCVCVLSKHFYDSGLEIGYIAVIQLGFT